MGPSRAAPPLWDRYLRDEGRVHLTGLQAIVRALLDQARIDRTEGRRVGVLVSGYPGSPLAGLDQTLLGVGPLLERHDVRFVPGLNEELAASTVAGTQLLERFPHRDYDGVVGVWFGKAPGLDRSLDAIRHSNFLGTGRHGGVLALVGDDPGCKSSSLPSHSDAALAHAFVPLLSPSDAGEVLELGLHGIALSRFSGLWVGLRVVADVADAGGTFEVGRRFAPQIPKLEFGGRRFRPRIDSRLLPPHVNEIETEIVLERLEAARAYARANRLDRIDRAGDRDRIGIAAAGWLHTEVRGALEELGIGETERRALGVRLLKIGLVWPLDARTVNDFASGLEQILVVDERPGFLETQVRSALGAGLEQPGVVGSRDERGEPWLSALPDLTADRLAAEIGTWLARVLGHPDLEGRARRIRARVEAPLDATGVSRPPHFCSGCPHSVSTRLPEGAFAGGGIGCHTMALLMDRGVEYVGAMGSEGAHWIGLSPYVETRHLFQNLGDGTYAHSGRLAVRAAVSAGARMTFKILYNGRIAMTGGQEIFGGKPVHDLVRDLLADGVRRVVCVSEEPALRRLARRDPRVECVPRRDYDRTTRSLAQEPGVTAIVYDSLCANEKQRLERRGIRDRPEERMIIHEDVCEGCGDCFERSACVSLRPHATHLGRKTRIHETSCSDDRTCVEGDCPSFLSVRGRFEPRERIEDWVPPTLPEPIAHGWSRGTFRLLLAGVGSTGVVTVNALLVRAAELEGYHARHLDQTGLSQRGGRVVSHCLLSRDPLHIGARTGVGQADTLLGFDPMDASDAGVLRTLDPERSRAVVHMELTPTPEMMGDTGPVDVDPWVERIAGRARTVDRIRAEAVAEAVFGSALPANVLLLGFACQVGSVPLRPESLEQAIRDRGVAVERNVEAFRLGRALAFDPDLERRVLDGSSPPTLAEPGPSTEPEGLGRAWSELEDALIGCGGGEDARKTARAIGALARELVDYQAKGYATRYLEALLPLARAERATGVRVPHVTGTAARELYRLMAYKDEYEVARLLLRGPFRRWLDSRLSSSRGRRPAIRYHLHPPLLRALGLRRKLRMGRAAEPLLALLAAARRVRGTRFDPFGYTGMRRLERDLVRWYEEVLRRVASCLDAKNLGRARETLAAAGEIRGFERVKADRAASVRERTERLLEEMAPGPDAPLPAPSERLNHVGKPHS